MSDCPNIENSFKNLLYTALLKKSHHRAHTGNVDMNLSVKKEKNHVSGNCVSGNLVNGNWEKGFFKKDCAPLLRERELEHSFESCVAQEQWWKLWPPNWEIGHSNRWSVALWIKGYQYFENIFDNFTFQTSEQVFLVIFYKFWWFPTKGLENIVFCQVRPTKWFFFYISNPILKMAKIRLREYDWPSSDFWLIIKN